MIKARVSLEGPASYDAYISPRVRWMGWACPFFTLDTVRQLAADTQARAAEPGGSDTDTVHVIDGGRTPAGEPYVVVLLVRWEYMGDGPEEAVTIIAPNEDGLYPVGDWEWCWYVDQSEAGECARTTSTPHTGTAL